AAAVTELRGLGEPPPPIAPAAHGGPPPASFVQEALWLLEQLGQASPAYNISTARPLPASIAPEKLERALNEVVRRHDVLRTTVKEVDGRPVQVVLPRLRLRLRIVSL